MAHESIRTLVETLLEYVMYFMEKILHDMTWHEIIGKVWNKFEKVTRYFLQIRASLKLLSKQSCIYYIIIIIFNVFKLYYIFANYMLTANIL